MADAQIEDVGVTITSGNLASGDIFVCVDISDTTDDGNGTTANITWASMLGTGLTFAAAAEFLAATLAANSAALRSHGPTPGCV